MTSLVILERPDRTLLKGRLRLALLRLIEETGGSIARAECTEAGRRELRREQDRKRPAKLREDSADVE